MIVAPFDTDFTLNESCQMILIPEAFSTPRIVIFNPWTKQVSSIAVDFHLDVYIFDCDTRVIQRVECQIDDRIQNDLWNTQDKIELQIFWRESSEEVIVAFHDHSNTILGVKISELNVGERRQSFLTHVRLIHKSCLSEMFVWSHVFFDAQKDQMLFVTSTAINQKSYFEIRRAPLDTNSELPRIGKGRKSHYRWRSPSTAVCFDRDTRRILFFGGVNFDAPLPLQATNDFFSFSVDEEKWRKINCPEKPSPRMAPPQCLYHQYWFIGGNDLWVYSIEKNRWKKLSSPQNKWNNCIDRIVVFRSSSREMRALCARLDDHSSCLYILKDIEEEMAVVQSTRPIVGHLRNLRGEKESQGNV